MTIYKCLNAQGCSCNGGDLQWGLPTRNEDGTWTPGDWMPAIEGELVPCKNGYHSAEDAQVLDWLNARLFVLEYRGERIDANDKIVVREARLTREITAWNDRTARLLAVQCAREALNLIDNPDPRSITACDVAERYANGAATSEELAAARDAAWAAARDAAWDAQYTKFLALLGEPNVRPIEDAMHGAYNYLRYIADDLLALTDDALRYVDEERRTEWQMMQRLARIKERLETSQHQMEQLFIDEKTEGGA